MLADVMPYIPEGLSSDEAGTLRRLYQQLGVKQSKNLLLSAYYDGRQVMRDLGIAIPPTLRGMSAALGWPAKSVQALTQKHVFDGFTLDGRSDPFGIDEVLDQNRFALDLGQGINAAYKHSCSFITTTMGDVEAGEPPVVIQARGAEATTALWDTRRRELSAFLAVIDSGENGEPTDLLMMVPGHMITMTRGPMRWRVDRRRMPGRRLLAEMLVHDPQLDRPFGRSRITREVRHLTDSAIRTMLRAEVHAEFFAAPQRYALGVGEDAFDSARWTATMGRLLALEPNEDGEKPDVGQFPQVGMGPHLEMYRQLAQNFCAATGLPQSQVGLFADNPASADAMQAAEAALAETAEYQWRVFKPALVRVAQNVVMLRDGLDSPPVDAWKLRVNSKPARYVSPQAAADFTVKAVGAVPKIGETTQALRGLGYSDEEIEGMRAEWRRAGAEDRLSALVDAVKARNHGDSGAGAAVPVGTVGSGGVGEG